uniref:Uncharacterized protein n=1 Tax=Zea mays TaxID=4577 RepID=A0A804QFC8_MAIZE
MSRPAGLRSFFPVPGCRLGTHGVALAEPEFLPLQEEDTRFVVVTFYKFVPLDDPHAEFARHLIFLQYYRVSVGTREAQESDHRTGGRREGTRSLNRRWTARIGRLRREG